MESSVERVGNSERVRPRARRRDRPALAFLLIVMAAGSLVLWIGIPVACSWFASRITDDATTHLQITVPSTIAAMVLFAVGLAWVNRLYLRILARAGGFDAGESPAAAERGGPLTPEEEESERSHARGPLEPILVASLVLALIVLAVWFFVFAENPPRQFF